MSIRRLLLPVLFLTFAGIGHAETILLTLEFTLSGFENATWELSSRPGSTDIMNVPVTMTGLNPVKLEEIKFFSSSDGGGLTDSDQIAFRRGYYGAQLYGGDESNPEFGPGFFALFYGSETGPEETLFISVISVPDPVPEPSSFTLLFSGLAAAGATAGRKGWLAR